VKLKYNDKVHGYWLDGRRCKGISTLSSLPDDKFQLEQWRRRMVLLGVTMNDDLYERAGDTDIDDNAALNALADEAMEWAGASIKAELGTADHKLTEQHDAGEDVEDNERLILARWTGLLDYAGIDLEPEFSERVVVYPDHRLCGRFDRFGRRRADGSLVALDLKTGASAVKYPHSVAVQLALYANAPLLAADLGEGDAETESFEPMPAGLDRRVGYMIHAPLDGEGAVYAVNLVAGFRTFKEVILPTLKWRERPGGMIITKI
jgi:hypothetical protein